VEGQQAAVGWGNSGHWIGCLPATATALGPSKIVKNEPATFKARNERFQKSFLDHQLTANEMTVPHRTDCVIW
jgi:hypothetical protein